MTTPTITDTRKPSGDPAAGTIDRASDERGRSLAGYVFMPAVLLAVVILVVIAVSARNAPSAYVSVEKQRLTLHYVTQAIWTHIELAAVSTVIVIAISVPLGILLTRAFARFITPPTIAVFNIGQAIPSIGVLTLLAFWKIGFWPVIIGLVAYSALSVLRNTMVGLQQVDQSVIESARGMGMTKLAVLLKIELPLAVPIMMAGLRTALVINVGTATLGALVGAGGLGLVIVAGINQGDNFLTVVGAALTAVLALLVDYVAGIAEDRLRPRGL